MGRERISSQAKKIKPHFWVFCEGKTEKEYIRFLKSKYRIQIEIVSKDMKGDEVDEKFIKKYKETQTTHEKDKDFLMYDADVPEVLERLSKIKSATLLVSNPSIELWFLLHYKNQTKNITTKVCERELSNRNKITYKKGVIDNKLEVKLNEKCNDACKRVSNLPPFKNPSSNMKKLIDILEETKKN